MKRLMNIALFACVACAGNVFGMSHAVKRLLSTVARAPKGGQYLVTGQPGVGIKLSGSAAERFAQAIERDGLIKVQEPFAQGFSAAAKKTGDARLAQVARSIHRGIEKQAKLQDVAIVVGGVAGAAFVGKSVQSSLQIRKARKMAAAALAEQALQHAAELDVARDGFKQGLGQLCDGFEGEVAQLRVDSQAKEAALTAEAQKLTAQVSDLQDKLDQAQVAANAVAQEKDVVVEKASFSPEMAVTVIGGTAVVGSVLAWFVGR